MNVFRTFHFKIICLVVIGLIYILPVNVNADTYKVIGKCIGENVNMRKGPGTTYEYNGQLNKDNEFEIISINDGWYKIKYNNQFNYVLSKFVDIKVNAYVIADRVNFRNDHSTKAPIIKSLAKDTPVIYLDKKDTWCKIKEGNIIGYVSEKFIKKIIIINEGNKDKYVIEANNLRLRKGPNTSYSIVKELSKGKVVSLLETKDNWSKIQIDNIEGWVSSKYIKKNNDSVVKSDVENNINKKYVIEGTIVNVRKEPNKNSAIQVQLKKDNIVDVVKSEGEWYKIKLVDGMLGYIYKDLITSVPEVKGVSIVKDAVAKQLQSVYVTSQTGLKLRAYPTTTSQSKKTLPYASKLVVYKTINDKWLEVKDIKGDIGFVHKEYISSKLPNNSVNVASTSSSKAQSIISYAKKFIGTRYVWGGNSLTRGIDCSGFTQQVMRKFNINLPRTAREQAKVGSYVKKSNLRPGDLIFFDTMNRGYISHCAIYIGNNKFIHSSSSKNKIGIIITDLSGFYVRKYKTARRVIR